MARMGVIGRKREEEEETATTSGRLGVIGSRGYTGVSQPITTQPTPQPTQTAPQVSEDQKFLEMPWWKQIFTKRLAKELPGAVVETVVEPAIQSGLSLYEIPSVVKRYAQGKSAATQTEYDVPFIGKTKSHLSNFENVADDVIEGKRPLWHALGPPVMAVGGVLDVYGVSKAPLVIKNLVKKPIKDLTDNEAGTILKVLSKEGTTSPADKSALDNLVDIKVTKKGVPTPEIRKPSDIGFTTRKVGEAIPEVKPQLKAPLPEVVAPKGAGKVGGVSDVFGIEKKAGTDIEFKKFYDNFIKSGSKSKRDLLITRLAPNSPERLSEFKKMNLGQLEQEFKNSDKEALKESFRHWRNRTDPHTVAYQKKLGIEPSAPKVEGGAKVTPKIEPEVVKVPGEQLPLGEGKEKVSRYSQRMSEILGQADDETRNLPTFKEMNKKKTIDSGAEFVATHSNDEVLDILKGNKPLPQGQSHTALGIGMEAKVKVDSDVFLARDLASLRGTRGGQEISLFTEIDKNSPVRFIDDLNKRKIEAMGGQEKIKTAQTKATNEVKGIIRKSAPTRDKWSEFVEGLKCSA